MSQPASHLSVQNGSKNQFSTNQVGDFDLKERVRAAVDILDVVGAGLELRPQGRNFVARCPWHNDRRPSMTVNPQRQSWKCWVCDIGGDVFSFVMQRDGVDFPTAVRQLAESAGIPLEQYRTSKPTVAGQPDDKPTLLSAVESITAAYCQNLESGTHADCQIARDYLASRGIDDAMRVKFRIGFAPMNGPGRPIDWRARNLAERSPPPPDWLRPGQAARGLWTCFAAG